MSLSQPDIISCPVNLGRAYFLTLTKMGTHSNRYQNNSNQWTDWNTDDDLRKLLEEIIDYDPDNCWSGMIQLALKSGSPRYWFLSMADKVHNPYINDLVQAAIAMAEKLGIHASSRSAVITGVSLDDLDGAGYDTNKVDDGTLTELASRMADAYCDSSFWIDLDVIAGECLGIPKKDTSG